MSNIRNVLIGLCMAAASLGAMAQNTDEHSAHHPADTAGAEAAEKIPPAQQMDKGQMAAMDQHMKAMQAMHEKMAAAKTPEERQALMADHMTLMKGGMAIMKSMGDGMSGMGGMQGGKGMDGDMAARQQMMEKRMDMMESMMQMMMDRMPSTPSK
ncbi:hypothetical protein Pres01_40260 [Metapseudomonas resinovorans]|uniref:hypothetical protein n=1 Tax=Metapseudomonas resinovorans TaxID=53412 RepID=UPI0009872729|nr:hypothetical protein [Pseudomonas resinovorans]GLZ87975.1 hypothetical protein Pres01_40260 [Pseudomonas resinovorans]